MKVIHLHQEEHETIRLAVENNRQAQQMIYSKHSPKMLSVCRQYIKDLHDAEDLMITAFMKVFTGLKNFEHKGSFEGWIRRIMINECLSYIRAKKKVSFLEDEYYVEDAFNNIESHFNVDDIQFLIDALPEGYKMIFNLYAIEGYKHQEIASMLGIGESTSKSQLHHARKMLQEQVKKLKITKMGRNKMEKDFSEKLNQREIAPSANAWDRLDAMLTVAEEKKPKRNFGWLYIAASIAGFLLIGTIYLSSTQELIDVKRNEVVLEYNNQNANDNHSNPSEVISANDSSAIAEIENTIVKETKINTPKSIRQIQNIRKTANESQLAENTINQNQINLNQNPIINQKTSSVSNVVLANNQNADELLAMAQTKSNPETAKASVKVNAKNLLSQVDGELEQTFRDKVINSVGKNYRNAKVAIANRNAIEEENH